MLSKLILLFILITSSVYASSIPVNNELLFDITRNGNIIGTHEYKFNTDYDKIRKGWLRK